MALILRIFAECGNGEQAAQLTGDFAAALAADGWVHTGDEEHRSSVWNRPPGGVFLSPAVRWAELIRFDEGRA